MRRPSRPTPVRHALAVGFVATFAATCIMGFILSRSAWLLRWARDIAPSQPWLAIGLWSFGIVCGAIVGMRAYRAELALLRRSRGRCAACNYDLRATPTRCPECGAVPPPPPPA